MINFGLSEKHIKFEKILLMVLTNQLIYLVNKIFQIMCASQKVRTLLISLLKITFEPNELDVIFFELSLMNILMLERLVMRSLRLDFCQMMTDFRP